MGERICSVDDCGKRAKSRGWCRRHYLQWWRTGDPVPPPRATECAVEGCCEPPHCRGWCVTHYKRWQYAGDPVKGTILVVCELCPSMFVRPPDGRTRWCDACRANQARLSASRSGKRRRQSSAHLDAVRARRQAASEPCLVCGAGVEQDAQTGPLVRFCSDECREAYQHEWRRGWRSENRDKLQARQHRRRALKYGAHYESFKPSEIFERDNWRCYLCGEDIDPGLDYPNPRRVVLEHVVPLDRGGHHTRENVRAAHSLCNGIKGTKLPSELSLQK